MQNLTASVGEGGVNARHDAALVQAYLVLANRPARVDPVQTRYLAVIDGDCGERTRRAIRQFQNDRVFGDPVSGTSRSVQGATPGLVLPGDLTWRTLTEAVPAACRDLRVLPGSKTVYIAGAGAERDASTGRATRLTFAATFRSSLITLINRMYDNHRLVVSVCREGDRRTFQTQYELLTSGRNVTGAGPGESNHNFGQAADLGFEGLRWLRANGTTVENETSWLHQLDPSQTAQGESLFFWNVLRTTGIAAGLHRGPLADRPHLQAWSDAGVDMASRLADLLTRTGRMRWRGRAQRYQCDLGCGGEFFDVGSAAQIWSRQAAITEATLTRARAQAARPAVAAGPALARPGRTERPPAVTPQEVRDMRNALRADFEAADRDWQRWRT
jgi:peptidoglycan hydrolase-like protein with peptidoglycan-binding domain